MKRLPLLLLLSFLALKAWGHPLGFYRAKLGSQAAAEKHATERAAAVRKMLALPKAAPNYDTLLAADGPFAQDTSADNGRKVRGSTVFKSLIQGAEVLYRQANHGQVPAFDPSNSTKQVWEAKRAHWSAFIETHLKTRFAGLATDFATQEIARAKHVAKARTSEEKALDAERTALMRSFLVAQYPGIVRKLGPVVGVDFVDEHVIKIRLSKADPFELELSLSMLITYRTQRDEFFRMLLGAFAAHVKQQEKDDTCAFIRDAVAQAAANAELAAQRLRTLTTPEVDALIDLFLTLKGVDVPLPVEMASAPEGAAWDPKSFPSVREWILSQPGMPADGKARVKALPEALEKYQQDLQYYQLMDDELDMLTEYLEAYRSEAAANKKVIDDIKAKK